MVEVARRHVQHGTMYRSFESIRGHEYIHSGKIGKALMAKAWDVQLRHHYRSQRRRTEPGGRRLRYLTGRPDAPFNPNRFHYNLAPAGTTARAWAMTECINWTSPLGFDVARHLNDWNGRAFLTTTRKRPTPST